MTGASIRRSRVALVACVVLASGCEKEKPSSSTASTSQPAASSPGTGSAPVGTQKQSTAASSSATSAGDGAAPGAVSKGAAVTTFKDVGLATPESVLYDADADEYLVSNINGQPLDVDGNGFVSKLSPDGKVTTLKWIEGGKKEVTLNAPKGMTITKGVLYVADIDTVRMFDRKTGAPAGEIKIAGATFVNDLATTPDGRVLASDSGLRAGSKGFEPSGSDAVYEIDRAKKVATPVAKSKELGSPNGLLPTADKTWVVTFGTGELYAVDAKGRRADVQKLPKGALDGIVALPGGELLVSSWEANAVFRGRPGGTFEIAVGDVKSPADIGWDSKRARLLVPLFSENEVRCFDVKVDAKLDPK